MARQNRNDIELFHGFGIHVPTRTIYIGSESYLGEDHSESGVDFQMTEKAIKNLHLLDSASDEGIRILMNNVGGDWEHGMAIYDAIRRCRSLVTIEVLGNAMSMGSVILQAADHRVLNPNAKVMIHYGTSAVSGHAKTAEKWHKEFQRVNQKMEGIYMKRIQERDPAFSLQKLRHLLDHDTILWAEEAVSMGLADEVLKEDHE